MENNVNKILFITEYLPYPPDTGAKTQFYYLIKGLASYQDKLNLGIVSLFEKKDEKLLEATIIFFNSLGIKWFKFIKKRDENLLYKMIRYNLIPNIYNLNIFKGIFTEFKPDVIFLGLNELSLYITPFLKEYKHPSTPIIFFPRDSCILNIETWLKNENSLANKIIGSIKLRLRKRALNKYRYSCFEKYIYLSERDAEKFKEFIQKGKILLKTIVIPSGVDTEEFLPQKRGGKYLDRINLLFTGVLDYPPNEDASLVLIRDIFPSISNKFENVYLSLVGRNPTKRILKACKGSGRIIITGYVENIETYYQNSDIYICPVNFGSGMKNKILEAMASGLPVISFYEGVSGINNIEESGLLVVNNIDEMLRELERLILNPILCQQLGEKNRNFVEGRYSWNVICRRYMKLFELSKKHF